jgi:hypothetical protein
MMHGQIQIKFTVVVVVGSRTYMNAVIIAAFIVTFVPNSPYCYVLFLAILKSPSHHELFVCHVMKFIYLWFNNAVSNSE